MLREITDFIKQSEQLRNKINGLKWDESADEYEKINFVRVLASDKMLDAEHYLKILLKELVELSEGEADI